jgi:hypothetical protein
MNGEQIVGVIPNAKAGMMGNKCFNVVVTNYRVIMAQLTSQMIKEEAARITEQARAEGKGRLGTFMSTATCGTSIYQRYFNMDPEKILTENPGNYFIDLRSIATVKVRAGRWDEENRNPNELRMKWNGGKLNLKFNDISAGEAKRMLSTVIPNVK